MPTCRKIKAVPLHEREHVFQIIRLQRTKKKQCEIAAHSKFLAAKSLAFRNLSKSLT